MPHSVVFDLGLHSLPMSHKKDTRLIKVVLTESKQAYFSTFWVLKRTAFEGLNVRVLDLLGGTVLCP